MIVAAHQPQYIPWLGYFHKIAGCDAFVFLDDVQYKKREFQNRNKVRTRDGSIWITVPVITKDRYLQKINEVEIDNTYDWRIEHRKSIELNYRGAPFFGQFSGSINSIYEKEWRMLNDLNIETVKMILEALGIKKKSYFSSEMGIISSKTLRIIDICKKIGADTYLSGAGGRDYMDESLFSENGIKLVYQEFRHPVYRQNYIGFEPYMSAMDLLFNCGPDSYKVLMSEN